MHVLQLGSRSCVSGDEGLVRDWLPNRARPACCLPKSGRRESNSHGLRTGSRRVFQKAQRSGAEISPLPNHSVRQWTRGFICERFGPPH